MKPRLGTLILLALSLASLATAQAQDPLPAWNDRPTQHATVDFVAETTTADSPEERIATFDRVPTSTKNPNQNQ